MRVLFTVFPGPSHLPPVVPLAWALQAAGHEVVLAGHPRMAERISRAGLPAVALGEQEDLAASVRACAADSRLDGITDPLGLGPEDEPRRIWIRNYLLSSFSHYYLTEQTGAVERPMTDELVAFARDWRPDLVIWDPLFYPAPIAARACGAAHARLLWGPDHIGWARARLAELSAGPGEAPRDVMAELMAPVLAKFGCDFDEELLLGQFSLDPVLPALRLPVDLPYVQMQQVPYSGGHILPEWLRKPPARPRVCLTLGMSEGRPDAEGKNLVKGLLDAVADLDVEVIATLTEGQRETAGVIPDNVRTADYVPFSHLMPSCSALVHHGGGGTFAVAVAHGVPQLIAPREVDDHTIAALVADSGAGLVVDQELISATTLRAQLVSILEEPRFREGAAALRDQMRAAPSPNDIVPRLEKLTAQHRTEA
ncbi:activator-dependent family glycosyltransferase [Streptomyces anulatus]|uniref:activator-dependent family glycosyltransferase n=1 Tax=Streptomyces anulatus TaxID=1892 RepID=UPI003660C759